MNSMQFNITFLCVFHTLVHVFFILQILRQHDAELKELEKRYDVEKGHQVQALKDKLAEKRRRKLEEQQRKHEIELKKEVVEQKKELAEVRTNQVSHGQ